jgi:hypothetical protein
VAAEARALKKHLSMPQLTQQREEPAAAQRVEKGAEGGRHLVKHDANGEELMRMRREGGGGSCGSGSRRRSQARFILIAATAAAAAAVRLGRR